MSSKAVPENHRLPRLAVVLVAVGLLAGCGATPRRPNDPLVETPAQEQFRTVAAIQWPTLFHEGLTLMQDGDLVRSEQYLTAAMLRGGPPEKILPTLLH